MGIKDNKSEIKSDKENKRNNTFDKISILKSKRFKNRSDVLSILLKDDEKYTLDDVGRILNEYMKKGVK